MNQNNEKSICPKHNMKLEFIDSRRQGLDRFTCFYCIQESFGLVPINKKQYNNQVLREKFVNQFNSNAQLLSFLIHSLIQLRESFIKRISIIDQIITNIRNQKEKQLNITGMINEQESVNVIQMIYDIYIREQNEFQQNIKLEIEQLKNIKEIDCIIKEINQYIKPDIMKQQIITKHEYKLLDDYFITQECFCQAIALNQNASIVAAGCGDDIKIFEFKSNRFQEVQLLQGHILTVECLLFFQKSNQLLSGDSSGMIKIWQSHQSDQWINSNTLVEHDDFISSILVSSNETFIISGSGDKSIKLWDCNNNKWTSKQKILCEEKVYCLSLNESNNKLLSSTGGDIEIYEYQGNVWKKIQQIDADGYRLSFINDMEFVFQPWVGKKIQFFHFNLSNKKFQLLYELDVNYSNDDTYGFPINFIQAKNLLLVKHNKNINVFNRQQDGRFILDQQILFPTHFFEGNVSYDGEFLITWDENSRELQIRKLNQKKGKIKTLSKIYEIQSDWQQ